mgnify:FL=1
MRRCPEAYRLERLAGAPFVPSIAMVQGTAFHETYREWEESDRTSDVQKTFKRIFYEEIAKETARTPLNKFKVYGRGRTIQEDIDIRYQTGMEQISSYTSTCLTAKDKVVKLEPDSDLAVEVQFEIMLGGTKVIGAVDVVLEDEDDVMFVRDLKTGARESSGFQLGLYAHALRVTCGLDITRGDYYYAKDATRSTMFDLTNFTEKYLTEQVQALDTIILSRTFLANPGPHCFTCSVKTQCREFN